MRKLVTGSEGAASGVGRAEARRQCRSHRALRPGSHPGMRETLRHAGETPPAHGPREAAPWPGLGSAGPLWGGAASEAFPVSAAPGGSHAASRLPPAGQGGAGGGPLARSAPGSGLCRAGRREGAGSGAGPGRGRGVTGPTVTLWGAAVADVRD